MWEGESLLFVLRERLGLWGSKNACEQGECGSCSVVLDGELVCACLVAAGQADGREILTVEGLGDGDELDRVQEAYLARALSSAASAPPGWSWPPTTCCAQPLADRCRDPGGAGRQPVPLHRVREDPRRRPPGRLRYGRRMSTA